MTKNGFWGDISDIWTNKTMKYIDGKINTVGSNNVIINGNSSVRQKSSFRSSTSVISQGGNKIEVTTKNGKTTIKVNGKEYVEKK